MQSFSRRSLLHCITPLLCPLRATGSFFTHGAVDCCAYFIAGSPPWSRSARHEHSDPIRCVKFCQPNDVACILDDTHSVSHTFISLPTFREFTRPEEIVFLRTTVPAYGSYRLGSYDVKFDIVAGNVDNAFDIIKRVENGLYVGVARQVKPLIGPLTTVLKLSMRNLTVQGDSGQNIINVYVFVSEFWF